MLRTLNPVKRAAEPNPVPPKVETSPLADHSGSVVSGAFPIADRTSVPLTLVDLYCDIQVRLPVFFP